MSNYDWCPTCGDFGKLRGEGGGIHKCLPAYDVWQDDYEGKREDAYKVHAHSHEAAAIRYVEQRDSDFDYSVISGEKITVHVAKKGEDEEKLFKLAGESVPQYYADEVKADEVKAA